MLLVTMHCLSGTQSRKPRMQPHFTAHPAHSPPSQHHMPSCPPGALLATSSQEDRYNAAAGDMSMCIHCGMPYTIISHHYGPARAALPEPYHWCFQAWHMHQTDRYACPWATPQRTLPIDAASRVGPVHGGTRATCHEGTGGMGHFAQPCTCASPPTSQVTCPQYLVLSP